jgi:cephalosporin hydroxylase
MQHFNENIHGWFGYGWLYQRIINNIQSSGHIVEVGTWKGRGAAFAAVEIINSGKTIQFDCVDTWMGSEEHQLGAYCEDHDVINGTLYDTFLQNMKPVEGHYNAVRLDSVSAAKLYNDNSLDFVFIDGAHDYDSVMADIQAWLPKVKPNGILAGDDTLWPTVAKAVMDSLSPVTIEKYLWIYNKGN